MDKNRVRIRAARVEDAGKLLEIYRPYVEKTAITFEYEVPEPEEFQARIKRTLKKYPYLVADCEGELLGYAYTGPFVGRAAYDWSCETTIYLAPAAQKCGLGRALYEALEEALRAMGILNLYACIAYPPTGDEYLTANSAEFHAHLGYQKVGRFRRCGYKFGRWYDVIWMEKTLGEHRAAAPITPYPQMKRV